MHGAQQEAEEEGLRHGECSLGASQFAGTKSGTLQLCCKGDGCWSGGRTRERWNRSQRDWRKVDGVSRK